MLKSAAVFFHEVADFFRRNDSGIIINRKDILFSIIIHSFYVLDPAQGLFYPQWAARSEIAAFSDHSVNGE